MISVMLFWSMAFSPLAFRKTTYPRSTSNRPFRKTRLVISHRHEKWIPSPLGATVFHCSFLGWHPLPNVEKRHATLKVKHRTGEPAIPQMGVKLNKNLNMRGFHPQGQQLMVPEVTRLRIISKKKIFEPRAKPLWHSMKYWVIHRHPGILTDHGLWQ